MAEVYSLVIKDVYNLESGSQFEGRKDILTQIHAENDRFLAKGLNLLLDGAIESAEYKTLKSAAEKKIT